MNEELKKVAEALAMDEVSVASYKKFLDATDRKRYFGYVDKKVLKSLCRNLDYTDTRSFIKGGIFAAVAIWAINHVRKSNKAEPIEETIETVEENV